MQDAFVYVNSRLDYAGITIDDLKRALTRLRLARAPPFSCFFKTVYGYNFGRMWRRAGAQTDKHPLSWEEFSSVFRWHGYDVHKAVPDITACFAMRARILQHVIRKVVDFDKLEQRQTARALGAHSHALRLKMQALSVRSDAVFNLQVLLSTLSTALLAAEGHDTQDSSGIALPDDGSALTSQKLVEAQDLDMQENQTIVGATWQTDEEKSLTLHIPAQPSTDVNIRSAPHPPDVAAIAARTRAFADMHVLLCRARNELATLGYIYTPPSADLCGVDGSRARARATDSEQENEEEAAASYPAKCEEWRTVIMCEEQQVKSALHLVLAQPDLWYHASNCVDPRNPEFAEEWSSGCIDTGMSSWVMPASSSVPLCVEVGPARPSSVAIWKRGRHELSLSEYPVREDRDLKHWGNFRSDLASSTLQCVVLECVAVCCSVLQCVAVCCSVLQCDAVCCSVLQCVDMMQ